MLALSTAASHFIVSVPKTKHTFKTAAPLRDFHFVLNVAPHVDKSGTTHCRKDLVASAFVLEEGDRNTALICTKPVQP